MSADAKAGLVIAVLLIMYFAAVWHGVPGVIDGR